MQRAEKQYPMKKTDRKIKFADKYAHRGFHDKPHIPENSMAAFRRAVEHGLSSEFDVHLIADGSLVVFHDEKLKRQTGVKGEIEDYDIVNLRKLRLEGTDEQIPTFDQVLGLYEDTGLPLLIELKTARGNFRRLAEAVCKRLDTYRGEFVLESFDPRAMMAVRKLRPEFIRGQLVQDFYKTPDGVPPYQALLLTNLAFNRLVQPDFIAYRFRDRKRSVWKKCVGKKGLVPFVWTIKSPEEYETAVREGCIPIFEQITPEELKNLER